MKTHRNALDVGARIDGYEIEAVIGHGGFGISYRALDVARGKRVALKEFLPTELATREADDSVYPLSESHADDFAWGLERFLDEVNLLARFDHPSIVRVERAFEANGTAYMVMAYEEGESLATRLKREGALDADALMAIIMPLLDGLEIVHDAGFIHRDIKPSNIYLRESGEPVLLDFGSARQALRGKTRTLTALVSAGYAPLEQYFSRSDLQGPWSDIYGLGATLYEAITGAAPIDAVERSRGVLGSTRDILPPAAELGAGRYPPWLLAAVDHALRMEDQERPRSIAEWRRELLGEAPVPASPETVVANPATRVPTAVAMHPERGPPGRPWLRAALGGLAAALLAGVALLWWQLGHIGDTLGDRIAEPRPPAGAGATTSRLERLRASLEAANAEAAASREQIAALTARLSELETRREPDRRDHSGAAAETAGDDPRLRERDAVIAELRGALETATRDGEAARERADELASRLTLLEAMSATDEPKPDARSDEIARLLAAAEEDLGRLRLTTPPGQNAHGRYRRVLELDPDNADARRGLERIVESYIALSAAAGERGDEDAAARFLERAAGILPGHAGLARAQGALAEAEAPPPRSGGESRAPEPVAENAVPEPVPVAARPPDPPTASPVAAPTLVILPGACDCAHRSGLDVAANRVGDALVQRLVDTNAFHALLDYRSGDFGGDIPDAATLWTGDAIQRIPDDEAVYRLGARLDVEAALLWRARPVPEFASWPITLHLFDIEHRRVLRAQSTSVDAIGSLDALVARMNDARSGALARASVPGRDTVRVAMLRFARRHQAGRYRYVEIVSSKLTRAIENHPRLELVYSYYDPEHDPSVASTPPIWTTGPVAHRLETANAIAVGRRLGVDAVVTAQNPIRFIGQWGLEVDEEDDEVEIYFLDVRSGRLHREKQRIRVIETMFPRLVSRATPSASHGDSTRVIPAKADHDATRADGARVDSEAGPLRVVIFPTSAGNWSSFTQVIVPEITRQLTRYVASAPELTLAYSFYADSAPGQRESPTYWNGKKALKKPDVSAIVSSTRSLGGDVGIAVFHWNTVNTVDNIRATRARLYVVDAASGEVYEQAGNGADMKKLADAVFAALRGARLVSSGAAAAESVN